MPLHGSVSIKRFGGLRSQPVTAPLALPDGADVVTAPGARAQLRFPDAAVLDVGSDTVLVVGPFNRFLSGLVNALGLMRGAIRLTAIPQRGFANYIVRTPLVQTAIRSQRTIVTIANSGRGQFVSCAVCRNVSEALVGATTPVTLNSGQTLTITPGPRAPIVYTVPNRIVHDRAVDQFAAGYPSAR